MSNPLRHVFKVEPFSLRALLSAQLMRQPALDSGPLIVRRVTRKGMCFFHLRSMYRGKRVKISIFGMSNL